MDEQARHLYREWLNTGDVQLQAQVLRAFQRIDQWPPYAFTAACEPWDTVYNNLSRVFLDPIDERCGLSQSEVEDDFELLQSGLPQRLKEFYQLFGGCDLEESSQDWLGEIPEPRVILENLQLHRDALNDPNDSGDPLLSWVFGDDYLAPSKMKRLARVRFSDYAVYWLLSSAVTSDPETVHYDNFGRYRLDLERTAFLDSESFNEDSWRDLPPQVKSMEMPDDPNFVLLMHENYLVRGSRAGSFATNTVALNDLGKEQLAAHFPTLKADFDFQLRIKAPESQDWDTPVREAIRALHHAYFYEVDSMLSIRSQFRAPYWFFEQASEGDLSILDQVEAAVRRCQSQLQGLVVEYRFKDGPFREF